MIILYLLSNQEIQLPKRAVQLTLFLTTLNPEINQTFLFNAKYYSLLFPFYDII